MILLITTNSLVPFLGCLCAKHISTSCCTIVVPKLILISCGVLIEFCSMCVYFMPWKEKGWRECGFFPLGYQTKIQFTYQ